MLKESTAVAPREAAGSHGLALDRWSRRAPLTGLLFVALVIVGGPVLEGSTPGTSATAVKIVAFYTAHRERERAGVIVLALAFVAFLFFAAALRSSWRRVPGVEGIAALVLAAATVVVVGQTANDGIGYALTASPSKLNPSSAQTLNLLANNLVVTSAIGFLVFGIASGLAILRGVGLPSWLGWSALVIGVLFLTPIEFVGFLLFVVWVALVSIISYRRSAAPDFASRDTPSLGP